MNDFNFDLYIAGGTPAGIACAVRAAREGLKVLLTNHTQHWGGMAASGLMQWDALYAGQRAPLFTELMARSDDYYRTTYGADSYDYQCARFSQERYPTGMTESKIAERIFNEMLNAEPNITALAGYDPDAVEREGVLIRSVTVREYRGNDEKRVRAATFVDATYEGDLAALAGVPYRVGREARDEFDEPHAGHVFTSICHEPAPRDAVEGRLNLHPFPARQGALDPGSSFAADGAVQAYNIRATLSRDPANTVLPDKPHNYNREEYLNYLRIGMWDHDGPNDKSMMNSPILPGENHDYPEGDWETREKIYRRHVDFALGLMYFLQNDESRDEKTRTMCRQWGLAKDEFADNNNIPYEMYVRETRRIVGRHVYTEHDNSPAPGLGRAPLHPDSIAITDWYMDSHSCTTQSADSPLGEAPDPQYPFAGKLILTEESRPGQIPYRSVLPQGVDNLLVPVCLSCTHIAWGAVRLEPTWIAIGEAMAVAATLAHRQNIAPARLEPDELTQRLAEERFTISFFNDMDAGGPAEWRPAVQYFGTKGFFPTYDAAPNAPLTMPAARIWAEAFQALREGTLDANALARSLMPQEKYLEGAAVGSEQFGEMLGVPLPAKETLSRGEACGALYALLKDVTADANIKN